MNEWFKYVLCVSYVRKVVHFLISVCSLYVYVMSWRWRHLDCGPCGKSGYFYSQTSGEGTTQLPRDAPDPDQLHLLLYLLLGGRCRDGQVDPWRASDTSAPWIRLEGFIMMNVSLMYQTDIFVSAHIMFSIGVAKKILSLLKQKYVDGKGTSFPSCDLEKI